MFRLYLNLAAARVGHEKDKVWVVFCQNGSKRIDVFFRIRYNFLIETTRVNFTGVRGCGILAELKHPHDDQAGFHLTRKFITTVSNFPNLWVDTSKGGGFIF